MIPYVRVALVGFLGLALGVLTAYGQGWLAGYVLGAGIRGVGS